MKPASPDGALFLRRRFSRRWLLSLLPAACLGQSAAKNNVVPSVVKKGTDPLTEFNLSRLTDPNFTSHLPAWYSRAVSRRNNFLLYSSDMTGTFQAYRMDLKSGESLQLTDAEKLDPFSPTLTANDRGFFCLDGQRLTEVTLGSLRSREVYRMPQGFESSGAPCISDDGLYAALVERNGSKYRLRLVRLAPGASSTQAITLAESDEPILDPVLRPRRASVLYRRGSGVWLANFDRQQNYALRVAPGETGQALWNPDGRSVLYLNYPSDPRALHNLREFVPDTNEDKKIADTTQFAICTPNADASVFVGASSSPASPHVLLLVRSVRRELTLAEHRASDPRMVAPVFSPNNRIVFFTSDRQGKPAIYAMAVDKLVEDAESAEKTN